MKKTAVVLGLILGFIIGACSQLPGFTPTPGSGPNVDSTATSGALFNTAVAQTLTAQPTFTSVPVTPTAVIPVASATLPPTDAPTTPATDMTTTPFTATSVPMTATLVPSNVTATPTLVAGQITPIWTLAVRTYGTLPPAVPFSQVTLVNKADAEAYISLQVTMADGTHSILEYPVEGRVTVQAPVGSYLYVTWVGGNKIVGNFRLHNNDDLSITIYKDKVVIK